nr:c-type cytochrome [Conexibacter arvalis]
MPRPVRVAAAIGCASLAAAIGLGALASQAPSVGAQAGDEPPAATGNTPTSPAASGTATGPAPPAAIGAAPPTVTGSEPAPAAASGSDPASATPGQLAEGRRLFLSGCASCHGEDARGIEDVAPSLRGVGAASADFYLRTGRMPMEDPQDEPQRKEPFYDERQIAALVAYVGSFGGPPIPSVDPAAGDLSVGFRVFGELCAGCHQIVGRGGITTGAWVPGLQEASPLDVAEAIEIGPYVMPAFGDQLTQEQVDSLARYVTWTRQPDDVGGWGIGHIGPVPEGMVAWLLAGAALLLTIRLIGERTTR